MIASRALCVKATLDIRCLETHTRKVKGGWCAGVSDGVRVHADNSVVCDMMKD